MRIAFNINVLVAMMLMGSFLCVGTQPANSTELPASPTLMTPPSPPALLPMPEANPSKNAIGAAGLANAESKIPDSVKDVLKRLDKPADNVTLDDLNSARQAVAKIEILIDIEKHLAELDKVRHERQKDSGMAAMIPASALQAPASFSAAQSNQAPVMPMPRETGEITQISGGGGQYSATLKMSGEESKIVHVGDHLTDGSAVMAITPTEVILERGGTKHTLHIKNINTVFGNSF